jgi:MYXO-CTERM domain-containing protein
MHTSSAMRKLLLGIVSLGAASLWQARASAEEPFPAIIAKDANMPCVATCSLCHTTNPGMAGTWAGKKFGVAMFANGATKGVPSSITTAFNKYKGTAATDSTAAAALMALQNGFDPDNGESLCGPTYGCGAHVAKKLPRSDVSAPLWALGAVIAGGILRRRRRANAS